MTLYKSYRLPMPGTYKITKIAPKIFMVVIMIMTSIMLKY